MHSEQLVNSQSTADVCLPESAKNVRNLLRSGRPKGIGSIHFGLCVWCEKPLRAKHTKPPKFCPGDACRKAFERHGKTMNLIDAVTESYHRQQRKKLKKEMAPASNGRLCRTPRSRSKFESATGVPCAFPKEQVDSNLGVVTQPPVPTKVLPEFRTFTPETPLFIGPLLKNGRRKRGRV